MAKVSTWQQELGVKMSSSYFPAIPPKAPKAAMAYSQAVMDAPHTALMGVVVDGRQPTGHPVTPRCRMRSQAGLTNRWRLPQSLGGDLLGTAQAVKAISMSMNDSMVQIITAENPRRTVNLDIEKPYMFSVHGQRPFPAADITNQNVPELLSKRATSTSWKPRPERTLNACMPSTARPAQPLAIFQYHSKHSGSAHGPDVLLKCLGINWELHRPFLIKSNTLAALLHNTENPSPKRYYRNKMSETLDKYISKNSFYSTEYQDSDSEGAGVENVEEMSSRLMTEDVDDTSGIGVSHPKHVSEQRVSNMTVISLDITDPTITPQSLAVALGSLYHEDLEVDIHEVVGIFAAAHVLDYRHLQNICTQVMLYTINYSTVCLYHEVSSTYHQDQVRTACECWLELNLVPKLSCEIHLRKLPMELLQKVLTSNRVFTYNEFWLYRVLAYWIFLQRNPDVQLMPSYSTVLTYFNSLPKATSLVDREEGQHFTALLMTLRLHGITDTNQIQDLQQMNIVPQSWIVKMLSQHYHALQGGGDMWKMNNFNTYAIREGFVIEDEPHYHSQVLSLHGFHFELKAVRQDKQGIYSFYMQRLKPGDPILSFRQSERHTFSMRPDREVRYTIRAQYFDDQRECQLVTTGLLTQRFGFSPKISKSEVLTVENAVPPVHVTYSLLFPAS